MPKARFDFPGLRDRGQWSQFTKGVFVLKADSVPTERAQCTGLGIPPCVRIVVASVGSTTLRGIDFVLRPGEVLGLVGEQGELVEQGTQADLVKRPERRYARLHALQVGVV